MVKYDEHHPCSKKTLKCNMRNNLVQFSCGRPFAFWHSESQVKKLKISNHYQYFGS